jgi:aminocarboxymuconate-semialdehyde decarboxylase
VKELRRCVEDLGLSGVQIGSHINNWNLDAPELFPIWAEAERLGAAIFVHPWGTLSHKSNLLNMPDSPCLRRYDGANARTLARIISVSVSDLLQGKDTMPKYWLPWLVGMPAETARAICCMIFGGVFERFKDLRVRRLPYCSDASLMSANSRWALHTGAVRSLPPSVRGVAWRGVRGE